jgi:hypothetical protein
MPFETDTLHVVTPLDPYEGDYYNDLVDEDAQSSTIESICKVMGCMEDYINPTVDGELSWRSVKYYDKDSEDALDQWKNNIYEVSTRMCAHILEEECMEEFGSYRFDVSELMDIIGFFLSLG